MKIVNGIQFNHLYRERERERESEREKLKDDY